MNELKQEHVEYFGRCKCCLQTGNCKNMWEECAVHGERQICGEVLVECFALELYPPLNDNTDLICESCIERLREASSFKSMILTSHKELKKAQNEILAGVVKAEKIDNQDQFNYEIMAEILDPNQLPLFLQGQEDTQNDEEGYQEVEFLDEEESMQNMNKEQHLEKTSHDYNDSGEQVRKRRRKFTYTKEELLKAIAQVRNKELKISQAAVIYNIPLGTLKGKMYKYAEVSKSALKQTYQQEKQRKLIRELQSILSYTNAIPFKVKTGKFYCAYCTTDGPFFDNTDTLRIHTVTDHSKHRISQVPTILRPISLNEISKVDINNLICTACYTPLLTWNDMFEHLKEHNLEFDEAYSRIIPFVLGDKLKCALCDLDFPRYNLLDTHMNSHYNNHICSECGDTFLSSARLAGHLKLHEQGRFPCEECGKVFSLDKYRVKHKMFVHKQDMVFKCLYCPAQFSLDYARHTHTLLEHEGKIKPVECEFCGKEFTWRPYYLKHLKRKHRDEAEAQPQDQD